MKVLYILIAGFLGVGLAAQSASAGWVKGEPKDIRIELRHPDLTGPYAIDVAINRDEYVGSNAISGQSDKIIFNKYDDVTKPFMFADYESGRQFQYERIKEFMIRRFSMFQKADVTFTTGVQDATSGISDVEYFLFNVSHEGGKVKRSCAYWQGFSGGNRFFFSGMFCPASREATDDDAKKAINSIFLKKQ